MYKIIQKLLRIGEERGGVGTSLKMEPTERAQSQDEHTCCDNVTGQVDETVYRGKVSVETESQSM